MLKVMLLGTLTLLVSACAGGVAGDKSLEAMCQRTAGTRTAHAAALADDGGVKSLLTGDKLILQLDGGCEPYDK